MALCNINVETGSVYQSAVDLLLRGPIPFRFERDYDSSRENPSALGLGWRHNQTFSLYLSDRKAEFVSPAGKPTLVPHPDQAPVEGEKLRTVREGNTILLIDSQQTVLQFEPVTRNNGRLALTSRKDGRGNYLTYRYWPDGVLHSVADSKGRVVLFSQDMAHHICRVSLRLPDSGGREIEIARYEFDLNGDLCYARSLAGGVHQYSYQNHLLVEHVNPLGGRVLYSYDRKGRCAYTSRDDATHQRKITWKDKHRAVSVEDSRGAVWNYALNERGQLECETDPLGNKTEHTYDPKGNLQFVSRAGTPQAVTMFFPERSLVLAQNGPLLSTFQFDDRGRVSELRNGTGAGWAYKYDEMSNRIEAVDPIKSIWQFSYDAEGWLNKAIDPLGHVLTRKRLGPLLVEYHDEIGLDAALRYDWLDQLTAATDGMGNTTQYTYSETGLPVRVQYADGSESSFEYDAMGNMTAWRDESGATTLFEYDRFGAPLAVTNAEGSKGTFAYDLEGNLTDIVNFKGETARLEYDLTNQLARITLFDGRTQSYAYDELGAVKRVLDETDSVLMEIQRDEFGRIIKKIYADEWEVSYKWGEQNQLLFAKNPSCTLKIEWTPDLRVASETCDGLSVSYKYDPRGNRTSLETSAGRRIEYEWDARSRLVGVKDVGRALYRVSYDDANLMKEWSCPSIVQRFEFDRRQRMTRRVASMRGTGTVLADRFYEYDGRALLTSVRDLHLGALQYSYSVAAAVIGVHGGNGSLTERYSYDRDHNLTRGLDGASFTYSAGGRLERVGDSRFLHNAAGSVVEIEKPRGKYRLEYNPEGQLARVFLPDGKPVEYTYDPLGRRISKTLDGMVTRFSWGQVAVLDEQSSNGERFEYLFLPGCFLPLGMTTASGHYTFILDQAGTPTEIAGPGGQIAWAGHLSLFGEPYPPRTAEIRNPFRFQGQYCDEETGFYYNRFRYYFPACGRYLTQDPLGLLGGANLYRYVLNPLRLVDPFGLYSFASGTLTVHPVCGWSPAQREDARKKMRAMNARLKSKGGVTFPPKPNQRCAKTAKSIYEKCQDSGQIPKDDDHNLNEGGGKCHNEQADHILEICMDKSGEEECANMQPLNESVNKSYGSQVGAAVAANPGATLTKVVMAPQSECTDNPNVDC